MISDPAREALREAIALNPDGARLLRAILRTSPGAVKYKPEDRFGPLSMMVAQWSLVRQVSNELHGHVKPTLPNQFHRGAEIFQISLGTDDTSILTERLTLTGLTIDDANEMVSVLDDDRLYEFTGGRAATLDELRDRYRRFVAGPKGSSEVWLNWIVRSRQDEVAVGTMQATISTTPDGRSSADVAWVIGVAWQGQGFASEAARSLIDWLHAHGVDDVTAHIHPDHRASGIVASRAGLHPTDEQHSRETVWRDKAK